MQSFNKTFGNSRLKRFHEVDKLINIAASPEVRVSVNGKEMGHRSTTNRIFLDQLLSERSQHSNDGDERLSAKDPLSKTLYKAKSQSRNVKHVKHCTEFQLDLPDIRGGHEGRYESMRKYR